MTALFEGFPVLSNLMLILLHSDASHTYGSLATYPLFFGIIAATAHVLSGPDHLAAVGPLAVNVKIRAWLIGMAWGIGHLIGMLLVGVLFYYFRELIPVEFISENSEKIVGGLLIIIGLWSLARLLNFNTSTKHKHVHTHKTNEGDIFVHKHHHHHKDKSVHIHVHKKHERQTYWAALGIGIIHGLAGVSHFISLLPTLAFPSNFDSALYLIGFGFGTILAMVVFSVILGFVAKKASKQKRDTLLKIITGIVGISAIIVGIYWILSTI
ncbi:MAG: nickel transporter [Marinilabiliales bacterium]|jgi:sulfite exporter TauE/SafE|nr:MAG: nickel transporter [Marinilabiliales bacterium]